MYEIKTANSQSNAKKTWTAPAIQIIQLSSAQFKTPFNKNADGRGTKS